MGFITTTNSNGRKVFACEIGAEYCNRTGCTAHHCPFGWCQRYYVCRACWRRPEIKKQWTKSGHSQSCKVNAELYDQKKAQEEALKAAGKYLRVAALATDDDCVHVIFKNGKGEELGRYMPAHVYQSLGYGTNTILEDYEAEAARIGVGIAEAPTEFAHTGTSTDELISLAYNQK